MYYLTWIVTVYELHLFIVLSVRFDVDRGEAKASLLYWQTYKVRIHEKIVYSLIQYNVISLLKNAYILIHIETMIANIVSGLQSIAFAYTWVNKVIILLIVRN